MGVVELISASVGTPSNHPLDLDLEAQNDASSDRMASACPKTNKPLVC